MFVSEQNLTGQEVLLHCFYLFTSVQIYRWEYIYKILIYKYIYIWTIFFATWIIGRQIASPLTYLSSLSFRGSCFFFPPQSVEHSEVAMHTTTMNLPAYSWLFTPHICKQTQATPLWVSSSSSSTKSTPLIKITYRHWSSIISSINQRRRKKKKKEKQHRCLLWDIVVKLCDSV